MALRPVQVKSLTTRGLAGERIEAEPILPRPGAEVEHILQRTSDCVKRAFSGAAEAPVILNETQNGALVGHGVIDEVALGEGRNYQNHIRSGPARLHSVLGRRRWGQLVRRTSCSTDSQSDPIDDRTSRRSHPKR